MAEIVFIHLESSPEYSRELRFALLNKETRKGKGMNRNIENNIKTYYWYKLLSNSTMRGPILIAFMTKLCHMPLSEVYFCEACCVLLLVILQIPTGVLADKWERANTVRIGCMILIMELICFASATDHILLWIGNALWAIGSSFISGADSALIYDSLKQTIGKEKELETRYRNIEGKSTSYSLVLSSIMCLFAGHIANINMRWPVIVDATLMGMAFLTSFFFIEPKIHSDKMKKIGYQEHMIESIKYVLKRSHILWIISFSVLIGVTSKLWFFTYNPYFNMVGLDIRYYGYVFFTLNIVCGISSYYADKISRRLENGSGVISSVMILTFPMIIMGTIISKWFISLVLFQNLVRGYLGPFISNMLNKRIDSGNRATVLSVKSAMYQAVEVLCMAMFAIVIAYADLGSAIKYLGIVSTLFGIVLTFYYVKLFRK